MFQSMASVLSPQNIHSRVKPILPVASTSSNSIGFTPDLHTRNTMEENERGRPRSRSAEKDGPGDIDRVEEGPDAQNGVSSNSEGPARKRRRSRKGLDKRFECKAEGCGKSYSRAEHLYVISFPFVHQKHCQTNKTMQISASAQPQLETDLSLQFPQLYKDICARRSPKKAYGPPCSERFAA